MDQRGKAPSQAPSGPGCSGAPASLGHLPAIPAESGRCLHPAVSQWKSGSLLGTGHGLAAPRLLQRHLRPGSGSGPGVGSAGAAGPLLRKRRWDRAQMGDTELSQRAGIGKCYNWDGKQVHKDPIEARHCHGNRPEKSGNEEGIDPWGQRREGAGAAPGNEGSGTCSKPAPLLQAPSCVGWDAVLAGPVGWGWKGPFGVGTQPPVLRGLSHQAEQHWSSVGWAGRSLSIPRMRSPPGAVLGQQAQVPFGVPCAGHSSSRWVLHPRRSCDLSSWEQHGAGSTSPSPSRWAVACLESLVPQPLKPQIP
ncbi:uncharacterized protein LOC119696162 [Motacilla alba alba]|uniref:uncharacterized protein LOC119696162 n=1 Tax=Motacilla alba alba TaxID=1094192 RepID=UPI0018D53970|nr:uncharacterized protein LOC119696162 [Motacilla alba alba]XP_037981763.1 uncharacterized protein LOC119696162 [Motacilla alba alba]